jgi:hypothetical protein
MTEMREPRRERRTVVEDVLLPALALGDGFFEDFFLLPEVEHPLLHPREAHFGIHGLVQGMAPLKRLYTEKKRQ